MITIMFALAGMLILMLQLMIEDVKLLYQTTKKEIYESCDHDTKIYQDYKYE